MKMLADVANLLFVPQEVGGLGDGRRKQSFPCLLCRVHYLHLSHTHTHPNDSTHRPHTQRAVMMGDRFSCRNFEGTGTQTFNRPNPFLQVMRLDEVCSNLTRPGKPLS